MTEKKQKGSAGATKLTEKEKEFCMHYLDSYNATDAYIKTYKKKQNASVKGYQLLHKSKIDKYITKLKDERRELLKIDGNDFAGLQMRIANAQISNFIKVIPTESGRSIVTLDIEGKDTSAISELQISNNGFKIKLCNRQDAINWLCEHLNIVNDEDTNIVIIPEATDE